MSGENDMQFTSLAEAQQHIAKLKEDKNLNKGDGPFYFGSSQQPWYFLGNGTFNFAFVDDPSNPSEVLKIQRAASNSAVDQCDLPQRSVRLWQEINGEEFPAKVYKDGQHKVFGWTLPYIEGRRANQYEISEALIDIYNRTGRVVVDGYVGGNFKVASANGAIVCVDIGFALLQTEGSPQNKGKDSEEKFLESYTSHQAWCKLRDRYDGSFKDAITRESILSIQTIKALLFLKKQNKFVDAGFLRHDSNGIWDLAHAYDAMRKVELDPQYNVIEDPDYIKAIEHIKEYSIQSIAKQDSLCGKRATRDYVSKAAQALLRRDFYEALHQHIFKFRSSVLNKESNAFIRQAVNIILLVAKKKKVAILKGEVPADVTDATFEAEVYRNIMLYIDPYFTKNAAERISIVKLINELSEVLLACDAMLENNSAKHDLYAKLRNVGIEPSDYLDQEIAVLKSYEQKVFSARKEYFERQSPDSATMVGFAIIHNSIGQLKESFASKMSASKCRSVISDFLQNSEYDDITKIRILADFYRALELDVMAYRSSHYASFFLRRGAPFYINNWKSVSGELKSEMLEIAFREPTAANVAKPLKKDFDSKQDAKAGDKERAHQACGQAPSAADDGNASTVSAAMPEASVQEKLAELYQNHRDVLNSNRKRYNKTETNTYKEFNAARNKEGQFDQQRLRSKLKIHESKRRQQTTKADKTLDAGASADREGSARMTRPGRKGG